MKNRTRTRLGVLLAAGSLLALAACSGGSSGSDSAASDSDTLVIATASQPAGFAYEISPTGYETAEFFENTGATLIRNPYVDNEDGTAQQQDYYNFEPMLAESYDVSKDGLTYTFHLDPDAVSVNGNTLTSEDVVFTMQRRFKTDTSINAFISAPMFTDPDTQVKAIDDETVAFTVEKKSYGFTLLSLLANIPYTIYDSTELKKHVTDDDPYAVEWSNTHPNFGFGAYSVADYTPGEQIVYEANEDFVLGAPSVKRIVQRVVSDAGQRANLLASGDVDIATQLRPADQVDLADSDEANIYTVDSNAFVYMPLTTTMEPFDDVTVRQALTHAIPYDDIINDVYRGRASELSGILGSSAPGYSDEGLSPYTYDPELAKSMLEDAGYTDPVEFTLTVNNSYPDLEEVATQIQTAAADAGFDVTIDEVNYATFQEGLSAKTFQASMGRDYAIVQSPPYVLGLFYTAGSPINWPNWEDQDFYDALDAGNNGGDPLSDASGEYWNEAEQIMRDQVPTIWMNYVQPLNAFATDVDGYAFRSDNVIDYSNLSVG
ncbi:ABC transporter substrate-binding protein [Nocardioides bruguierae]|uniref:ABC transporter substrate-binding protein n=1 Tax=Nocardioides bruguierae TaxID=2945102 RepID=UPI002021659A|nr:ABC transporter substrate-binding protein [Nocardioides bruguierae]MCL8025054.1 ABC transporter substrate-binding protein [Nocardioides bruguierae]